MKKTLYLVCAWMLMQQFVFAQCYPDRHSTNFFDGWISCEAATNPNPDRPAGHFIMYDFEKVYALGQMTIWNTNDPSHLDWGMRDVVIDYSLDGETWETAGNFTFAQASGLSTYEGETGPYLNEVEARYLLITALSNYGGSCYGLSEMNVVGEEVIISDVKDLANLECVDITIYPNPFAEQVTMVLAPGCSGDLRLSIYDSKGTLISTETASLVNGHDKSISFGNNLPSGAYNVYLEYEGKTVQRSIVKMNRS